MSDEKLSEHDLRVMRPSPTAEQHGSGYTGDVPGSGLGCPLPVLIAFIIWILAMGACVDPSLITGGSATAVPYNPKPPTPTISLYPNPCAEYGPNYHLKMGMDQEYCAKD